MPGGVSKVLAVVDADRYHGTHFFGCSYAYPWARAHAPPGDDGTAWPRHHGACNVLWLDGHVTSVEAPDPGDPESLYRPEALSELFGDPDYWMQ